MAPAGISGNGGAGRGLIPAGGPEIVFSVWVFHTSPGSANFAPDGSKVRRIPARVEITIVAASSKAALLKCFI